VADPLPDLHGSPLYATFPHLATISFHVEIDPVRVSRYGVDARPAQPTAT